MTMKKLYISVYITLFLSAIINTRICSIEKVMVSLAVYLSFSAWSRGEFPIFQCGDDGEFPTIDF